MELKSIDNLLKPTTKASASLQTKVLMKKILFEKEISKIKEIKEKSKFFEKENFLNDNVEISNISLSLPKQFEKSGQKPLKKKEEIDECLYVDFREEIEKRFRKSVINKIYIFPRINEDEILFESFNSESSNESLKNIETYNLQSQKPKTNIKKTKQPDQEKERKNLSFQDFLTKIQEEKNKWTTQNSNASSYKKKSLVPSEETLKKPTKPNLKNSESVIQINRSSIEKNEENNCHNFSLLNKKASAEAEREKMNIKVIKGRNVIDLIPKPQKTKLNMSGSNSKRKENISANIFSTINSFHNKLLPKDK